MPTPARLPTCECAPAARASQAMDTHIATLSTDEWLAGGAQFTLADVGMLPIFERLELAGWAFLWDDLPNVARYWAALRARPSYASAMKGEFELPAVRAASEDHQKLWASQAWYREAFTGGYDATSKAATSRL